MLIVVLAACTEPATVVRRAPRDHDTDAPIEATDTSETDTTGVDETDPTDTDTTTTDGPDALGIDVSHWNGDIDWDAVLADGQTFVYIKATQDTNFADPEFARSYEDSAEAGLYRGGYHFAEPNTSSPEAQVDWFIANGGGWVDDGKTLPGALDIEWNPGDGGDCYGLSKAEMSAWIHGFVDEYRAQTGVAPVIYCGKTWWGYCVDESDFGESPLWVASWDDEEPYLPAGWSDYAIWQTGAADIDGIDGETDVNVFNGSLSRVRALARGEL